MKFATQISPLLYYCLAKTSYQKTSCKFSKSAYSILYIHHRYKQNSRLVQYSDKSGIWEIGFWIVTVHFIKAQSLCVTNTKWVTFWLIVKIKSNISFEVDIELERQCWNAIMWLKSNTVLKEHIWKVNSTSESLKN